MTFSSLFTGSSSLSVFARGVLYQFSNFDTEAEMRVKNRKPINSPLIAHMAISQKFEKSLSTTDSSSKYCHQMTFHAKNQTSCIQKWAKYKVKIIKIRSSKLLRAKRSVWLVISLLPSPMPSLTLWDCSWFAPERRHSGWRRHDPKSCSRRRI